MHRKFSLVPSGLLLLGAALNAQPPSDFQASPEASVGFESSVKAAMAPSIARQRAAIQKQAASLAPPAGSSFFTIPSAPLEVSAADCDPLPAEELDPLIQAAAQKTGVEPQLLRAVIAQESAGRPCALSAQGAEGLMQLMPATAEEFQIDDPFDPQQNVEGGAKLLKSLLERYRNDPSLALGAYNAGAGRVDQQGGVPAIPETMDYVIAILDKLGSLNGKTEPTAPTPVKNSGW
jgi:soluble lytic murein transglycosylase-like protein